MKIEKGTILNFRGSWGSGIGYLVIQKEGEREEISVPCENGATVRALSNYVDCITTGHGVDVDKIKGMEIFYAMEGWGTMAGLVPTEHATPEMWDLYESGYED
jgi:hypothetical protein